MALDYTKKARKHSQIKAVGALVCHNLRKSQTFSILQQNSPDAVLLSFLLKRWNGYVKVSGATQATKTNKKVLS